MLKYRNHSCIIYIVLIFLEESLYDKADLYSSIAEKSHLSRKHIAALNASTDCVQRSLAKGEKIHFIDFGTFETTEKSAIEVENPRTKDPISIQVSTRLYLYLR